MHQLRLIQQDHYACTLREGIVLVEKEAVESFFENFRIKLILGGMPDLLATAHAWKIACEPYMWILPYPKEGVSLIPFQLYEGEKQWKR